MNRFAALLMITCGLPMIGCGGGGDGDSDGGALASAPAEPYTAFFTPLPETSLYPPDNPYSEAKERLGEFLFWDPILSGGMNVACASCHHPDFAWADGRAVSVGVDGIGLGPDRLGERTTEFHSPSVLNAAFAGLDQTPAADDFVSGGYFWDLRAPTLEAQAVEPIRSTVEMLGDDISADDIFPQIVSRLQNIPEYVALFDAAFEGGTINESNIAAALATFQRKLITPRTRFDEFLDGDASALTPREVTGLNKFINGGCADCHSGPLLSDFLIDEDRPVLLGKPAVRTPGLREVELTPPYMHDGSSPTLRSALVVYDEREDLDLTLGEDDVEDVEAFLATLTSDDFYRVVPEYVPSGLSVGGDIYR